MSQLVNLSNIKFCYEVNDHRYDIDICSCKINFIKNIPMSTDTNFSIPYRIEIEGESFGPPTVYKLNKRANWKKKFNSWYNKYIRLYIPDELLEDVNNIVYKAYKLGIKHAREQIKGVRKDD